MFQQLFRNMGPVVKNILLINVVMFVANMVFKMQGVDLNHVLGAFYWDSEYFEPYQILTHMFMHDNQGFLHILFNMFALLVFGSQLERVWGAKRFLLFYLLCGLGAYALNNAVTYFEIQHIQETMPAAYWDKFMNGDGFSVIAGGEAYSAIGVSDQITLYAAYNIPGVGASGAIFGILAAFAYLFPNTELYLMFIPVPIKAKWMVIGYAALELYLGLQNTIGDSIAHFAHLGGGLIGFILVLIWQRNKKSFY